MANRKLVSFDFAIKYLLRQKDNFEILEGFLTALLNEPIEVLDIIESESNKNTEILKGNRVDLMIRDSKDRRIIVEIQHASEVDYLERMVFETSKTIVDNLDKGKDYGDIVKVISINILYFNLGEGNGYAYKGELKFNDINEKNMEKARLKYPTDKLPEYYIIRTNKFKNIVKTALDEWIYMFKNNEVREDSDTKGISLAKEKLDILKMDENQKREYDKFIHNRRVSNSILATAKAEGEEQGRKKGLKEGLKQGKEEGLKQGEEKGLKKGLKQGKEEGLKQGEEKGLKKGLKQGKEEGLKQGKEEGLKEKTIEIAISLLDILDDETIALKTKLSLKEIQKLRKRK
ncbi:hypothetical protein AN639_09365 [Candidatus Epulonipiscium fishelsonii]|uniref:Uncharacterized protein n=1 Tax=Candidatus Epulonipiscium fishelsonii TaxID=77094 RepID=A0ACC8XE47_9FIRM|nr:hypothetical protein AN639_09365 [Epulopiscium sp. SCG-B05WGA-EpuloA1]ONI41048.1 hypothetical protein AN396_04650 [Epulopiscium sp. SCG-B11WGA-EpuloA1]